MRPYTSLNPATNELLKQFPETSDAEVQDIVGQSFDGYGTWRRTRLQDRAAILRQVAKLHRERADELAALITLEMGKPITQSLKEIEVSATIYEYYADNAAEFLAEEKLSIAGTGDAVMRTEPIGPIVGVMPWNYPSYQVARFAAPNIMLGNTVIVKHARNCPQIALAIQKVLGDAGLPEATYINAFASSSQVATMIADPRVRGVSLTGSEQAGAAVGEVAGKHMKKFVLELGGSDPLIVLEDADVAAAVDAAVAGRMINAGQVCTASKRIIVLDQVYDEFLAKFTEAMSQYTAGDPADPATRLGPLSSESTVRELAAQVDDAIEKGATLLTGGHMVEGPGTYYPATVLADVTPAMRAYAEELFGPAAVVHRAESVEHAVSLANDSAFGLASSIFSADEQRAMSLGDELEVGMVWINSISRSAPDLPFGGVKSSGVGRELGRYGFNEFSNKKLVRIPRAG